MKLSMCLIARDERENVERCFTSFWDHVDEVVLVDTGSTDDTVQVAKAFAKKRGAKILELPAGRLRDGRERRRDAKLVIAHFEWCDDFSAARNYADSLASGDWLAWADLDDEIVGLDRLRKLAEEAQPDLNGFYADYEYVIDPNGVVHCELTRERLVRPGVAQWQGRVHEFKLVPPQVGRVTPDIAKWVHHGKGDDKERNLLILLACRDAEPDSPRIANYLATELVVAKRIDEAMAEYERYLAMQDGLDTRAQARRRYCGLLLAAGRLDDAHRIAVEALAEHPGWPDTYLTLAEIASERGNWPQAIEFANEVIRRGKPDTALILNPVDYTVRPRVLIAQALANMSRFDEAVQTAEQALAICPGYLGLDEHVASWRGQRHRHQVAEMWAANAGLLIEFDEPQKAAELLDTVPYYSYDHPSIIGARATVAHALEQPYKVQVMDGTEPRAQFLVHQLEQQAEGLDEHEAPFRVLDPAGAVTELLARAWPGWTVHTVSDDDELYDAVIVAGDLDNTLDPRERLKALAANVGLGGRLYVTVPEGRIGRQATPGRRRAFRSVDVASMLRELGEVESFGIDEAGWMSGSVTPKPKRQEIAVWTGYAIGPWHPMDIAKRGLGGSETAAWRIAEQLADRGYVVTLYGHFAQEGCVKDVILRDFQTFDPLHPYHALIAFRDASIFDLPHASKHKLLWLEDVAGAEGLNEQRAEALDLVCTVSEWHHGDVLDHYPWINPEKVITCRNGIHLPFFERIPADVERELRVLYTSSPDRGLDVLLEMWPDVLKRVPDATLYHSYGPWYDIVADHSPGISAHRRRLRELGEQPGVHKLPPQGQGDLALLMRSSLVWCAPSYFSAGGAKFNETSCISAMEAQAAGLHVVASKWGALTETVKVGRLIDGDPMSKPYRRRFVDAIVAGLTDPKVQAQAQEKAPAAVAGMGWEGVADQLMLLWGDHPNAITMTTGV